MTPSEKLRDAINKAVAGGRMTRYAVAKASGVEYSTLSRWLDEGRDIRASTFDSLCQAMGLELREKK